VCGFARIPHLNLQESITFMILGRSDLKSS
jgi:hypothetical protein